MSLKSLAVRKLIITSKWIFNTMSLMPDLSIVIMVALFIKATEMRSSRKNPYPPQGRSLEIPRGRGVLKTKILEVKYEDKLEFPGGRGVQNKKLSMGQYGQFLELHNVLTRNGQDFSSFLLSCF